MSSVANPWLDPERDDVAIPDRASLSLDELASSARHVLGESLVAQRLITVGTLSLESSSSAGSTLESLERWGHTAASRVAVLLPPPALTGSPVLRRARRKYQEQLLRSQANWPDLAATTNAAFLICSDSLPPEIGLPTQLYPSQTPDGLLELADFQQLLDRLVRTVSPELAPAWISAKTALREALATIVAETFKNTHDHARREVDLSDVSQSLRGIYARYYSLDEIARLSSESRSVGVSPALQFARAFLPAATAPGIRTPTVRPVRGVLEISVFDAGPGMAAKWLRRNVQGVPIGEQLDAVISCFTKGSTTTGTQGRGYGLAKVLVKLRELHGFVGIRTNQLQVYRQFGWGGIGFGQTEGADGVRVPLEKFYDWQRHFTFIASERLAVKGTVVSFLLPMGGA